MDKHNVKNLLLCTDPPMSVEDVLDKADGVYFCIKNAKSAFLWVNQNFADLVGETKEELIKHPDTRAEHVKHDQAVMASGKPLLNFFETIDIPTKAGIRSLEIVTQKGLLRKKGGDDIIGITVCFAKRYPDSEKEADAFIERLKLTPTTVGGYFASGPGGDSNIPNAALPKRFAGDRKLYSSNYYLLKAGEVLRMHSLNQDEQWFFHRGSAIRLHMFTEDSGYSTVTLGEDEDQGQVLQAVARHNQWFGGEILGPGYVLVSCSLAPGYDSRDSSNPSPEQIEGLKSTFPDQLSVIEKLTQGIS